MIHIIEKHQSYAERSIVETMFEDRKRLFVDLYRWDIPVVFDRYEMDQFDTDDTIYIALADEEGRHEASIRLMASTRPHMLHDIFPYLCPAGVPVGAHIWESTRLCLPQRHGAERRRHLRNVLISRMVDLALDRNIACLTGVLPEPFRKEVLTMGWAAEPLGPAVRDESGMIGAFAAHVTPDTPARLGWTGVYVAETEQVVA